MQVDRDKAKNAAREILSSDLPVDDILIDEVEISDVVRKIFSEIMQKTDLKKINDYLWEIPKATGTR